jgi:hypothetical protein
MFTYPNVPRCHYIKVNGTRCGSPALRNQKLCYFHQRWHEQRIRLRGYPNEENCVEIPVLEDANSIQMALTQVMRLVLNDKISNKQAGLLLYALQIASANLRRTKFDIADEQTVVIDPAMLAKAGVGVDSWKPADFPNPIPADPAPDAAFTPDPAQPVYVTDKKVQPDPAVIPELKAQAEPIPVDQRKSAAWILTMAGVLKPFSASGDREEQPWRISSRSRFCGAGRLCLRAPVVGRQSYNALPLRQPVRPMS